MLNRTHFKITLAICIITTIGMGILSVLTYRASFKRTSLYIENTTELTSESIYYQIEAELAQPVNISLAMANDTFLIDWLKKEPVYPDDDYIQTITNYLKAYQDQYGYEAMFLASANTNCYYTSHGIDRLLEQNNPENNWFFYALSNEAAYNINVDYDRTLNNEGTVNIYINCRMEDEAGNAMAILGVGYRLEHIMELLTTYENEFGINAFLVDSLGQLTISNEQTASILENITLSPELSYWKQNQTYVFIQRLPLDSWYLVIEHDTSEFNRLMKLQLTKATFIGTVILLSVLLVVSIVVRKLNRQLIDLVVDREKERQAALIFATEQLYDNIYEVNITKNKADSLKTIQYFENLEIPRDSTYDDALKIIAQKQIKKEFQDIYVDTFSTSNVLHAFDSGLNHISQDLPFSLDGMTYVWLRIDGYIYYSKKNQALHMFVYHKNIDKEKQRELHFSQKAELDEMTMTYNKSTTERRIRKILSSSTGNYALFLLDIDYFKQVNDEYGHAFGDLVLKEFAAVLKKTFRQNDLIGRVGGDEFLVFIPVPNPEFLPKKAKELSEALDMECSENLLKCKITASIGIAVTSETVTTFEDLYKNADQALYKIKKHGRNGYSFYTP